MGEEPNGIQISAVSSHHVTKSMGLALGAALGLSLPTDKMGVCPELDRNAFSSSGERREG